MKKTVRKLLTSVLALAVACTMVTPITVEAEVSAPEQITLYRTSNDSYASATDWYVGGLSSNTKIYPKTVKSSNKSVIEPTYIQKAKSTYQSETTYLSDMEKPSKNSSKSYYAYVGVSIKKAGTATISYKIGNKTYKTKVTAKKYTNPIKTFKISGIKNGSSTNLASKLNKQNSANLKLSGKKKNVKLSVEAKSGWKINSVGIHNSEIGVSCEMNCYSSPKSKVTDMNVGTLKASKYTYVSINMYNTSNGAGMNCYYYINN